MTKFDYSLAAHLPAHERDNYHEGLGDLEPVGTGRSIRLKTEPVYGRRRIVFRVPFKCPRSQAEAVARAAGVAYESCFPTARYWVFVVYE